MAFDWKTLVGTVAPTLATALGGPLAGLAVKAIAGSVLNDSEASEVDIIAALSGATPEMLSKLKEADQHFAVEMKRLDIDLKKIAAEDRNSARDMQKTNRSLIVPILGTITVGGFFAVVGLILSGEVPLDSTLTGFVLGAVSSKAEQVYNFFFGSSVGSKEKTQHMANIGKGS